LAGVVNRANIWVRKGRKATSVVAALACALIALAAIPALASAALIEVNSAGDATKSAAGPVCEAAGGECTLRAAIEVADEDPLSPDQIEFSTTVFNGEVGADEIILGTSLPPITGLTSLVGHDSPGGTYHGPAEGVIAPAGEAALTVDSNGVSVEDMAFGGGEVGIEVEGEHIGFSARGDWFGLKLDAGPDAIGKAGIVLGPGSDEALIGAAEGDEELTRNVFGNSEVGIFVDGASHTKILGNYIGVGPEGNGPASLEVGVRIVNAEGPPVSKAEENEVGGVLTAGQAASTKCDGACNVIATQGVGVDLTDAGETEVEAASGPTTIRGNYLGLAADGITPVGEASVGVFAAPTQPGCGAGPADVTVGGAAPTETNYIDGGSIGLFAEGAENFRALGNAIGFAANGSAGESPIAMGIEICAEGVTEPAQIANNDMLLGPDAIGVASDWGRAEITGNAIQGSWIGVVTGVESEGHGDLIRGNSVTQPDLYGIEITNQSNVLIGNSISGAGRAGILLEEADHNRVGGDLPGEENVIDESGRGAVVIDGTEEQRNEVAANHGSGNAEAFIQLFAQSAGELLNGGIEPPTFATVLQSTATGTAQPDAAVRIFSKASAEAGELASLLAVAKADASGNWQATYATVPVGTLVAATQTSGAGTPEGATSEVSTSVTAGADPVVPAANPPSTPATPISAPAPAKAPKVKITKGPAKKSRLTTAKFRFTATPTAGAKFQCKLDAHKWARCKSPRTFKHLKPREHTFRVRAVVAGLTGPAATFKFTVKP
jgi:hypothetical protein